MLHRGHRIVPKTKDGHLTTAGRRSLDRKEFAVAPREEEKHRGIKGRYPIYNVAHARNALARVAQHGSPEEQEEVRKKVHEKFPDILENRRRK